ncbi:MAG: alpha/beta hydrolase [Bacteroidota bacterium]
MKKVLLIIGLVLLLLFIGSFVFLQTALPPLPNQTEQVIEQVMASELPALQGEEGYAMNGETRIWYESIPPHTDSSKGSILLIMGISNDALAWPGYFLDSLRQRGYHLVRFDNRGTGLTDWEGNWSEENPYTLEDMAQDGLAVLDELGIGKAHVIGVSLGGMIAQALTIQAPGRVLSLTSMLSSGNVMDPELPGMNMGLITNLILAQVKYGIISTESNQIKLQILARSLLQGEADTELDIQDVARTTLYNLRHRDGFNSQAFQQQSAAVMTSGSRYEALQHLQTPCLIVHGTSDPLIHFAHGKKCFELIPGAKRLWLEGMGHDIPIVFVSKVVQAIDDHISSTARTERPVI